MIWAIRGLVVSIDEQSVRLALGPIIVAVLIPAADLPSLAGREGEELTLQTIFYIEGDARGGNLEPRLIGFLTDEDRAFFNLFITVKGIGPRRALRALSLPVGQIAAAIENKDARFLVSLPEIGKRTAEQVIAELSGKVGRFVTAIGPGASAALRRRPAEQEDAITALMGLGERRPDAERLLERVMQLHPHVTGTDALLREMLRLRA